MADVRPAAQTSQFPELYEWWQQIFWPSASPSREVPQPPVTGPLPTPGSVAGGLEQAYHIIEPWVRYGFELGEYAVGWIPYVGWLAPQVMILYNFGERIVHAIVHNTLDWIDGDGSFGQNLAEGISWSVDALIQLGIDELNFFLPNLPPLPPFPGSTEFAEGYEAFRTSVRDFLGDLSDLLPYHDEERPPVGSTLVDVSLATTEVAPTAKEDVAVNPAEPAGTLVDAQPGTGVETVVDPVTPKPAAAVDPQLDIGPAVLDTAPVDTAPAPTLPSTPKTEKQLLRPAGVLSEVRSNLKQARDELRGAAAETKKSLTGRGDATREADDSAKPAKDLRTRIKNRVEKATDQIRSRSERATSDAAPAADRKKKKKADAES
ncbi:hypothetical protein [Mycolicibacterium arseniciresistens]|uniref:PE-PPE domain-containing protein n=1 Tax=Mycolicibacterium arseniciresistens TaxID=3062257 RepID=A0ABT8UBV3_9MYCO|nr:hypothetical protein [Mycolicibacterium arseniciresistens]MDO3635273.1 hypothetical protein [Mycolicibacterium arseniciresistens]